MNEERRRRTARAYYAMGAVFIAVVTLLLCFTVFFRVNSVEVRGVSLYTGDQIVNVGGTEYGMNLVRTDTERVEKRLKENLVYLDEVEVTKDYPDTIVISCKEAVKAADILFEDEYYVLSYSGKLLEAGNRNPTGGIPVVEGFVLDEEKRGPGDSLASDDDYSAKVLMSLLNQLKKHGFDNVSRIDITSRADIVIDYDGRLTIKLGSSADLDYKLSFFSSVIDSLTEDFTGELIYNGGNAGASALPSDKPVTQDMDSSTPEDESSAQSADSQSDTWWVPDNNDNTWTQETTTTTTAQIWWTPEEETTTEQVWWTPEENNGGWTAEGGGDTW